MINIFINTLKNTPAVTTLVDADNIFPLFRLQGSSMPCIVVQLVQTIPVDTHDQAPSLDTHTVEVTTFHTTPLGAWKIANEIRNAYERFTDSDGIDQIRFVTQATDIFEVTEAHSITQRYECHQNR